MPANLPPQYYELERQFNKETDLSEKLRLAKELLAIMPKHKGTDKLQADLKAKISKLKQQLEGGQKTHGAHHHVDQLSHIDKEGAAQIILIGPPNSGKSSILDYYTNAKPLVADYPYSTHEPKTGMMTFETIQFQLIDTPPISDQQFPQYLPNLIRQADLVVLVCDISDQTTPGQLAVIASLLEGKNIILASSKAPPSGNPRFAYKKTIIAAYKYVSSESDYAIKQLQTGYPDHLIAPTSFLDDDLMERFKRVLFEAMNIIRVYTKRVGHDPDFIDPVVLPKDSTVGDAAFRLHKDFAERLQFARVWGKGKFEGQRVKNSFVLSDEDILEFHI